MAEPIGSFSGLASGIQWRDMVDQIMKLESSRRLSPIQTQLTARESRRSAWSTYGGLVGKLKTAAASLMDGTAFRKLTATAGTSTSGTTLFTATASTDAAPGKYRVEVLNVARAEKLNGDAETSTSEALGVAGEFFVNGRRVELATTDSLATIRDKVNAVNAGTDPSGVTATILSTSATEHRLILTADNTGTRGIELVDGATGALQSLGVLTGVQSANTSPTDSGVTQTQRFQSKTSAIATMLGVTAPPASTTIVIDGQKVTVDLLSDTMISIMNKVATAGGTASIVEEKVGADTQYRLAVDGAVTADATASDPAASQRIVEMLGFVTSGKAAQITSGQDARLRIDGFSLTRRSNTVSDAISGLTIDVTAADISGRSATATGAGLSVLSAGYTPVGTHQVAMTQSTNRTTGTTDPSLVLGTVPGAVAAGSYAVNVTSLARVAVVTGATFDGTYSRSPASGSDWIQITDGGGNIAQVNLSNGESLSTIVTNLNNAFLANGSTMQAVDQGGQLRLVSTSAAGSSSTFTVASSAANVATELGIANGTYTGADIQGTIGGQAAVGSGSLLTGGAATSVDGLQVTYTGAATGAVGSIDITDTTTTSVTLGGVAAVWDAATQTISGAVGTEYEGVSLSYTGALTTGTLGTITGAGEIAAELAVTRDTASTVAAVQAFASAFNEIATFAETQRGETAGLHANGTLRAMLGSIKSVLLTDVPGLVGSDTPYVRGGNVGVALSKTGQLEVDAAKLGEALSTNLTDVMNLFANSGIASDGEVLFKTSTANTDPGTYAVSITAAATRASHLGSDLGGAFTYAASDGVSDSLTITDSYSGVSTSYVVQQGKDLDTIVSELNSVFGNASMALTAERSGNSLRIVGSQYGTAHSFTLAGAEATTRLGVAAATYAGTDVQGTIGGNAATGAGQVLTGSAGFATEGLAITYLGTAAKANAGTLRFARGLAGEMDLVADAQARENDGSVAVQTDVLDRSIELLNDRIDNINARLEIRRQALIKQFTRMEEALSQYQSQSSSLLAQISSLTASAASA